MLHSTSMNEVIKLGHGCVCRCFVRTIITFKSITRNYFLRMKTQTIEHNNYFTHNIILTQWYKI